RRSRAAARVAHGPPSAVAGDRSRPGAHRLHAVRRLADPRVRSPPHQVSRTLERARDRERGEGGREGRPRSGAGGDPRCARRDATGMKGFHLRRARAAPLPPLLCRWDLDKTYLRSEFDTLRQLWRTARERGEDKVEVPGVPEILKGLRAAADRRQRT